MTEKDIIKAGDLLKKYMPEHFSIELDAYINLALYNFKKDGVAKRQGKSLQNSDYRFKSVRRLQS